MSRCSCAVCNLHGRGLPIRPEISQYAHNTHNPVSCEQEKASYRSAVQDHDLTDSSSNGVLDLLLARVTKLEAQSSGDFNTGRISKLEESVRVLSNTVVVVLTFWHALLDITFRSMA